MPIYKPTELNQFLESLGARPNKKLSQNFLIDGNILRNIVKAADVQPQDQVLEIGPGPGSLTEMLLEKGAYVVAVETDKILGQALERLNTPDRRLKVILADALKVPLSELFASFPDPQKPIKLISNLPYHITTPLLARFVTASEWISLILVMVQEEVAIRMSAHPGTKDYGSISVFLNFFAQVNYCFKVSRNCFYPVPKVDSAIVRIEPEPIEKNIDVDKFFKMTRSAFQQKRKSLRSSLKKLYPHIEKALAELTLAPLTRPEELSCAQWISLYRKLST